MILGIAGTLGAGKGTVVEYLKQKGFVHYSTSGMLKAILESQGQVPRREAYTWLGDSFRDLGPAGPIAIQYGIAKHDSRPLIIESIHDVPEAEFLKQKGAIILGVDAPLETRYERIQKRGSEKDNVTFEQFKAIAIHEEDGGGKHNIRAVIKMADAVIENNSSFEELRRQVDDFLASIGTVN
ncbi:AAA family ATPase [Candidatus Kaiserbacteria bacterium]|nr:AAA family ATPase [Candidatus Kaiserbacteria bacterium]